ncbi:MAG: nickel pincer cofactor biosynthesis protein LarB [Planctomycetota bacterium]|nr:nickel pincer cofactor biosynthesis protein LarB [Planctomycetota bacterium]
MDSSRHTPTPSDPLKMDTNREIRCGFPEAVFAEGKTPAQVTEAMVRLSKAHDRILATRASQTHADAVAKALPDSQWNPTARCITWRKNPPTKTDHRACILSGGTSDLPVVEEAKVTLELFGIQVDSIPDVGVAGLHRLMDHLPDIRKASVVLVCAGMEGALPSVVGGLVSAPVIAIPTSVGYGANFEGLAALLAMLNSCSPGIGVVNIDNGFGAAVLASRILQS